ncbi:hypothetical protein Ancab_013867 [Ancistrocladus abbreviatus]
MSCSPSNRLPPPWEVLLLVAQAHHLDPPTLAKASCVCKLWSLCFSSDHLWAPLCTNQFPSLSPLHAASFSTTVPYRRLYSLGYTAGKRRLRKPPKPQLSLDNLLFTVDIRGSSDNKSSHNNHNIHNPRITLTKPCSELKLDPHGLFRFDIDVINYGEEGGNGNLKYWNIEALSGVKIAWHVVVKGWEGVFKMMERGGKGSFAYGVDGWFSEELPAPGCCSSTMTSGLAAELRLGIRGLGGAEGSGSNGIRGGVTVEKVNVGVLSILSWRYVSVDDALGYLQHFLQS